METKVIVLGQAEAVKPVLKEIEFVKYIDEDLNFDNGCASANIWENIELISKNYKGSCFDLMYAYDKDRNLGCLYIGHFNDGIV